MLAFFKNMFCNCNSEPSLEKRQEAAREQDKMVRESLTEKQQDKELKDTMEASDPVTKY